jgi:hypothetical protein
MPGDLERLPAAAAAAAPGAGPAALAAEPLGRMRAELPVISELEERDQVGGGMAGQPGIDDLPLLLGGHGGHFQHVSADADLYRPAGSRGPPVYGGDHGAQPVQGPELDQQPAGHRPEPFRPLRGGLGDERGDRGRIHVEQFGAQPSGQVRQFFRVAVGRRQHLHDQPIHIRDDPTSDDPDPAILSPPAQVNAA